MKKVLENDLCIVDYSETLQSLAESTMELLKGKIPEYEEFFCVKLTDKIKVNYFDNLQEFRDFSTICDIISVHEALLSL